MKEVTICFSFSVSATQRKNASKVLDTLAGWCIDGIDTIETRKLVSNDVYCLLELLNELSDGNAINSLTLCERKQANGLGDLKHEIPTSAKGDKP